MNPAAGALLFEPIQVGTFTAANRCWLPAMVTWLGTEDGSVTDDVVKRYVRYARGGVGTIVLEAMGIRDVASGPLLRISHDRFVPGLRDLRRRIADAGDAKVMPRSSTSSRSRGATRRGPCSAWRRGTPGAPRGPRRC